MPFAMKLALPDHRVMFLEISTGVHSLNTWLRHLNQGVLEGFRLLKGSWFSW